MIKGRSCPLGQNNLIFTLSSVDRALIEPQLRVVKLDRDMVLEEPGTPIRFVYFPTSGVGSTVTSSSNGGSVEVGLFGFEGMSGMAVLLQAGYSTHKTFMQIGGEGLVIDADILQELMQKSSSLQRHLIRYVQVMLTQTAQTALSNRQSVLEERLARWLLMCHDRSSGDAINLTHQFLAIMLGVRRAGVTVATQVLEGNGLIRANRGRIVILDRAGLENEAHESYGIPEAEYSRLFGINQPEGPN